MSDEINGKATSLGSTDGIESTEPTSHSSSNWKVLGKIAASDGIGVLGHSTASSGTTKGVVGKVDSTETGAAGVVGEATASTGQTYGLWGSSASTAGYGLGTSDDALISGTLDLAALAGALTQNQQITDLLGTDLGVQNSALSVTQLPAYETVADLPKYTTVGSNPSEVITAMKQVFADPSWGDPSLTYEHGPKHGEGDEPFDGATVAPTGDIVFAPTGSDYVGIYDPVARQYTSGPAHGESTNLPFRGALTAPTGEVVFVPYRASNVGLYDRVANEYVSGPAHNGSDFAFAGAAVAPNGKVIFAPYKSSTVGVYDPVTNTYTDGPTHGEGDDAFQGAALAPNGTIIFGPYGSDNVGIYDPAADSYTSGAQAGTTSTFAFKGVALAPTGDMVLAPLDEPNVGLYDPSSDTYTQGPAHNLGDFAFKDAILAASGEVVFVPVDDKAVGVYDPYENAFRTEAATDGFNDTISGVLAPTGDIVFAPQFSDSIEYGRMPVKTDLEATLHPLVNSP